MAVRRALRFQILRRDNHACRYCGAKAPEAKLTVDHVIPEALGGTDDPSNLVTACDTCNGGKSATPPDAAHVAGVSDDQIRWAAAVKAAAESMLAKHDERLDDQKMFERVWLTWGRGTGDGRTTMPLGPDWRSTVDRFRAAGLPLVVIVEAIPIAMTRNNVRDENRFNYLCGVLWNKVTELHQAASEIVAAPTGTLYGTPVPDEDLEADAEKWQILVFRVFEQFPERLIKESRDRALAVLVEHGLEVTDSEVTYYTVLDLLHTIAEGLN